MRCLTWGRGSTQMLGSRTVSAMALTPASHHRRPRRRHGLRDLLCVRACIWHGVHGAATGAHTHAENLQGSAPLRDRL